ncbi:hypothetical protein [Kitasatospora kifunensis]|uniref:Uncharacterized protein n=1 Tax=Kitasatospora kifunensis TaxID=58351 RepID=A0A7W7R7Z5_KITKI|nr:hypothetical protein [Kitasatospora kifunensis]MBB4927093.1 hypothetical protein [Kitasatospora kifunensis]
MPVAGPPTDAGALSDGLGGGAGEGAGRVAGGGPPRPGGLAGRADPPPADEPPPGCDGLGEGGPVGPGDWSSSLVVEVLCGVSAPPGEAAPLGVAGEGAKLPAAIGNPVPVVADRGALTTLCSSRSPQLLLGAADG